MKIFPLHGKCIFNGISPACTNFPLSQYFLFLHFPLPSYYVDADPDPSLHSDADPDPSFHSDADPGPTFHFDEDMNPTVSFDVHPDPVPLESDANLQTFGRTNHPRVNFEPQQILEF